METKTDISYGVIPIRREGNEWKVFVIHQFSRINNNSYWIFPKGHPEGGEAPLETAARELKEETDMEVKEFIEQPTFSLEYDFVFDGVKVEKKVVFFIGITDGESYKIKEDEVREAGWYSLSEAEQRLDYKDTKKMFAKAKEFIINYRH